MVILKKVLKLRTLIATSAGLALASSVYSASIESANAANGGWVVLAILIAGLINGYSSTAFAELATMFPTAGGVQVFIRHAFGPVISTSVSLLYIILAWSAGAAEAYIFSKVITFLIQVAGISFLAMIPEWGWVTLVLSSFFLINLLGVQLAGRTQVGLTFTMFILLISVSLYALIYSDYGASVSISEVFNVPDGIGFFVSVALAVYLYIGFEWVTPMVEEAEDSKLLAKAMPLAILLLAVTYSLFTFVMIIVIPPSELINQPVPHLIVAEKIQGFAGIIIMGVISFLATFTSFNAGMMGNSRLLYGMAREGVLPGFLAKIHLRFFTPWSALLFMFVIQWILTIFIVESGSFLIPILLAAIIESLIYALVALTVIKLRKKMPDYQRPFRMLGYNWMIYGIAIIYGLLIILMLLPPTSIIVHILLATGLVFSLTYSFIRFKFMDN